MKRLSSVFRSKTNWNRYAYCSTCDEWFIDDVLQIGPIFCPNACMFAVIRGFSKPLREIPKGILRYKEAQIDKP